jgi:hypothetical protein
MRTAIHVCCCFAGYAIGRYLIAMACGYRSLIRWEHILGVGIAGAAIGVILPMIFPGMQREE